MKKTIFTPFIPAKAGIHKNSNLKFIKGGFLLAVISIILTSTFIVFANSVADQNATEEQPEVGLYAFPAVEQKYFAAPHRQDARSKTNRQTMSEVFAISHGEFLAEFESLVQGREDEQMGIMKSSGIATDGHEKQLMKLVETVQQLNKLLRKENRKAMKVCRKQKVSVECE